MSGYTLYPSRAVELLRSEFPDHLICELHDQAGRPVFTATPTALRRSLSHADPEREAR